MTVVQAEQETRIELRLSHEEKQRLERAASESGRSLDDFITRTLLRAADDAAVDSHLTVLSDRDFQTFQDLVEAEAVPNDALKAAAKAYQQRLADGTLQTC